MNELELIQVQFALGAQLAFIAIWQQGARLCSRLERHRPHQPGRARPGNSINFNRINQIDLLKSRKRKPFENPQ